MNALESFESNLKDCIGKLFPNAALPDVLLTLNTDQEKSFGDLSCNVAMILAKQLGTNPREVGSQIKEEVEKIPDVAKVEIAGPGFINIELDLFFWEKVGSSFSREFFSIPEEERKKYIIEFVSANPTGPLHLGAGRGGIIGDVLGNILQLLGHSVTREYYINDAGNQINTLGESLKARCLEILGEPTTLPENGYQGEYLIPIAENLVQQYGNKILNKPELFFSDFAKNC